MFFFFLGGIFFFFFFCYFSKRLACLGTKNDPKLENKDEPTKQKLKKKKRNTTQFPLPPQTQQLPLASPARLRGLGVLSLQWFLSVLTGGRVPSPHLCASSTLCSRWGPRQPSRPPLSSSFLLWPLCACWGPGQDQASLSHCLQGPLKRQSALFRTPARYP